MRIRFRRSQRMSGLMSKSAVFSLEARVDITDEEVDHIRKYKMGQEIVYKKERVSASNGNDDTWTGLARNFASYATALTIRIDDLIKGTKIECKDIMEMMAVENQVVEACQTFKSILQSAAYFEGEEVVEI